MMIESKIQIENGPIWDMFKRFGFIYLDADERTAPDEKEDAVTNYIEEPGEHRDGRTVYAPFDYTAKFLIEAPNKDLVNVNTRIADFNRAIREQLAGGVMRKREIAFYNLLNRVKIVGYPHLVAVPTEVHHSNRYGELDYAEVELKISVSHPDKCDFDLLLGETLSGRNIVVNSMFEGVSGWVANYDTVAIDPNETYEGRNSVRLANPNGDKKYASVIQPLALSAGEYTWSAYMKYRGDLDWASSEIQCFDAENTRIYTVPLEGINTNFSQHMWHKRVVHFSIPEEVLLASSVVRLAISIRSTGTAWVSSPMLEAGNNPDPQWTPSIKDTVNNNSRAMSQTIMTTDLYGDNCLEFPIIREVESSYGEFAGDGGEHDNFAAED